MVDYCGGGGDMLPLSKSLGGPVPRGWLGGAMVLGKLPVPGHPSNLDYSRARA